MHMTFEKIEDPNLSHRAPIDCTSAKGVTCDICFAPMPALKEEHPAHKAARIIKEMHGENIAKIDGGFVFLRDGIDVSADVKRESTAQIVLCEAIMARAEHMDPKHREPAKLILDEFERIAAEAAKNENGLATIPEIGNYGHDA